MPDWKKEVSERLGLKRVHEEAVRELAAHLEETYENARARGLSEANALAKTLQELDDCGRLAKAIRRKSREAVMNNRTKTLWIPAMITLLGASLSLMILQKTGFRPNLIWKGPIAVLFYLPWLASLPLPGAAGAYLAQREHARISRRLLVAMSPALLLLVVMSIILPLEMIVDGFWWFRLVYFAVAVVNWVVVPGAALLLGAVPFLRAASEATILKEA